jgi:acyl dehydratase
VPLDYDKLMAMPPLVTEHVISERDTILYALGVGATELRHVYEDGLQALPTMAVIVAYPGFFAKNPRYGLTWQLLLHGEQSIELHRPLPVSGRFVGETTFEEIFDKGADKGAVMLTKRVIREAESGIALATARATMFLRGDGGFGQRAVGAPPKPHLLPENRAPDAVVSLATRNDQAVLYRLSGDYNPLHIDPTVATAAGFARPILHGLCTYGIIGRALLAAVCGNEASRFRRMDVRFSSVVYPGETIRVEIWYEGAGCAGFRALAEERGTLVVSNGYLEFG